MTETTKKEPRYVRHHALYAAITWTVRILIGALFVFSGMSKGIDPWGTIYKFSEYYGAMGFTVWAALNVAGVFFLCLLEFLTGVFLITGCFRNATPIVGAAIMAFMLPLTLWLAISNPISDCGCFGDALHLSNWATFWKNVIISAGVVWLLFYNRKFGWLVTPYLQWIASVASGIYFIAIAFLGYYYQPLVDFRPYKIGTSLITDDAESHADDEADYIVFIYEKEGVKHEFTIDDELPDEEDGWKFIERTIKTSEETPDSGKAAASTSTKGKNIRFFSEDGEEDMTDSAITEGRMLILMIPSLSEVPAAKTWKINSLYEWCRKNDIDMIATVGGNPSEIEYWKDIALPEYPIYTSDDTAIEEVVRGNPALVYLDGGIIKWKSSLKAIDIDDFLSPETSTDPANFARDNGKILLNLTSIYLLVMIALVAFSFSPRLSRLVFRKGKHQDDNENNTGN